MNAAPSAASAVLTQPAVAPSRHRARDILNGRVLTIINWENADMMAAHLDEKYEGLVITGAERHKKVRKLRLMYPELVVLAEGDCHSQHYASDELPWHLPSDTDALLPAPDLHELLDAQRQSGASVALLPSGFVEAGDHEALRSIVAAGSATEGDDIALPLYLGTGWLKPEHKKFLVAAIGRSAHPVLLSFGSSTNPLDSARKLTLYREIVAETGAFCWRTDLAGLAAFAHGGMGAGIGAAPNTRRCTPPKDSGRARRPDDATPNVLIPGHMHWMKTRAMREEVYVGGPAPKCWCRECEGERLDRFDDKQHAEAARHSHAIIDEYVRELVKVPAPDRPEVWRALALDAVVAHESTSAAIGRPWNVPEDVAVWAAS